MRNSVRAGLIVVALVALTGSSYASGSYSGSGFTPPKTKKETKSSEAPKPKSKPKKSDQ